MSRPSFDDFNGKAAPSSLTDKAKNKQSIGSDSSTSLHDSTTPLITELAETFTDNNADLGMAVEKSKNKAEHLKSTFHKEGTHKDLSSEAGAIMKGVSVHNETSEITEPTVENQPSFEDFAEKNNDNDMVIERRVKMQDNKCKFNHENSAQESSLYEVISSEFGSGIVSNQAMVLKSDAVKTTDSQGIQSLYQCAESLLSKITFIIYQDNLYYYNGKCYNFVTEMELIKLYRERVDPTMGGEKSMGVLKQLHMFLLTSPADKIPVIDEIPNLNIAVFNNGVYDIQKKEMVPHNRNIIAFSHINADFVKDAECPVFEKFLDDTTGGNEAQKRRIYEVIGYICSQNRGAKCFIFMGLAPNSGKSQLGGFVERLFPPENRSNVALSDFNSQFGLSNILGSAVNVSLDLPKTKLNSKAISRVKMLTGSDTVQIDKKFETPFSYHNRAVLIFASNHPIIAPDDEAFWERCLYIPFDYTIREEDRDNTLMDKLIAEKDAIVSKSMKYARKLIKNKFKFTTTDDIELQVAEWSGNRDRVIERFLGEHCSTDEIYKENKEAVSTLYEEYENFCEYYEYSPKTEDEFKKFLTNCGLSHGKWRVEGKANPVSAFKGIKIIRYGED